MFKTANNVTAALKKLQYINFIKDDLGVLPQEVGGDDQLVADENSEIGYERLCLLYFMIAMTQLNFDRAFDFLALP